MKKFFKILFIILGVIFLLLLIAAAYLYFWLRSMGTGPIPEFQLEVPGQVEESAAPSEMGDEDSAFEADLEMQYEEPAADEYSSGAHPLLNDSQEKALKTVGIDPATLPTELTPAQEQCFVDKLGTARVMEIVNGATPTPVDFLKAKGCIE